ncbi:MAG: hypothetical protein IIW01_07015, partial [Thermoguttaceae bacterium]|nr:hypothetical protein [Thermoguttaceae bacterium]
AAEKAAAEKAAADKAAAEKAAAEKAAAEKAAAEKAAAQPAAPAPAPAEAPQPTAEPAPAQPAPAADAAPKTASIASALFFSASRALLKNAAFGALVVDGETAAPAEQAETAPEAAPEPAAKPVDAPENAVATDVPGVYVVLNEDGVATIYSSDEEALDEFQRRLTAVVDAMKTPAQTEPVATQAVEPAQTAAPEAPADEEAAAQLDEPTVPNAFSHLSYMTPENREKARERVLMESRNYTVYRVKNVGVQQILPRLQTWMADRAQNASPYYYYQSSGVSITNMQQSVPLSFQPDVALNTITVYGSKADRDVAGAMIVHLDTVELFPQEITKPHKIKVANTSPTRMAQQVLNAFSRKFQTTLMPGNQSPRIYPNVTTGNLEVYAPENLALEIEEYVKEVDREILEESVRKVRVVELKSMNSTVLTQYLQNLSSRQTTATMLSTPYVPSTTTPFMPQMTRGMGMTPRFYGGMGGYGGYPGMGGMGGYPRNRGF